MGWVKRGTVLRDVYEWVPEPSSSSGAGGACCAVMYVGQCERHTSCAPRVVTIRLPPRPKGHSSRR